jgi:alkylation response protein AidB-like acyl-CoA dehydrogenase
MNFGLTEEQTILKKAARDFLEKECPRSTVRQMAENEKGYSPELWKKMAGLGWIGLAFPLQYGGSGGTFLDLVVLLEEMGRVLLPGPFFTTVVQSGLYILNAGNEKQKEEFLPAIAGGSAIFTMALTESTGEYNADTIAVKAITGKGNYSINGAKLFVPHANISDYILCVTRTRKSNDPEEGITTFIVDARAEGITCNPLATLGRDHQYEVIFNNTTVPAQNIVGKLDSGWTDITNMLQQSTVALCADMNGGSQKVLDLTINYAKDRVQFGHPIGSLTAIQHQCANMAILLEASRSLTYEAAWRISRGLPHDMEVSMAKSKANECYVQITQLSMMIHGGVGIINEHDLPLYYRRAKTAELLLGDTGSCREKVASSILDR